MTIVNYEDADEAVNALEDNEGEGFFKLFKFQRI
jgi:hypothetical protein